MTTPIGFCGLGAMGMGMATHLVSQGHNVTGYDVWPPSLEKFTAAGGVPSTSLRDSALNKPFYIVMVASALQAQPALFDADGIVNALPQGATLLVCSTVPSTYIKAVEKQLVDIGRGDIFLIDAPVSGGAGRAAAGTLSIMAGGSDAAIEKGKWLLQEMSAPEKLFIVAGGIGAGSNMKMVHQVLAAIQILAVSEAYGFAARLGLNGKEVCEAVVGSKGWSWMFENRSARTLSEDYFPGASAVTIILKDTVSLDLPFPYHIFLLPIFPLHSPHHTPFFQNNQRKNPKEEKKNPTEREPPSLTPPQSIITSLSRTTSFPTPLCTLAEQVYFSALDRGWGANDDAGIVRLWTSTPVSTISSTSLTPESKSSLLQLVVDLLTGIHLVAAAEALSLAQHVGIPLDQFYVLACDAAGGSTMFAEEGKRMIEVFQGKRDGKEEGVLKGYAERLKGAVDKAQEIKCPVYLGGAAVSSLLATGPGFGIGGLLGGYSVK